VRHGLWVAALGAAAIWLVGAGSSRPAGPPSFQGSVKPVPKLQSWHRGCPVAPARLRLLRMTFLGFDGAPHIGELVIAKRWAAPVLGVFRELYEQRFPIRRMKLVEAYASDDDRVGLADDTSGFNCRFVKGTTTWSEHAFGRAIDVNPLENPYVVGGKVSNRRYRPFSDRSRRVRGMIHPRDKVVRAFEAIGWHWGGYWTGGKDYQHFSATGR
jgi:D-alanyl-D-alanine carboxypeptidase